MEQNEPARVNFELAIEEMIFYCILTMAIVAAIAGFKIGYVHSHKIWVGTALSLVFSNGFIIALFGLSPLREVNCLNSLNNHSLPILDEE